MSVEALLGTDRGLRRRPAGAAPASRPGAVARPTCARCWPARPSWPVAPRATDTARAGRLLAALRAAGARRGARHRSPTRRPSPARELASAIDNPVVLPDGRVESNGNFHGAPVGLRRSTSWRSPPPTSPRSPSGAPTGMLDAPAQHGLPPFLADDPGVDSGLHDRAVHAGRDRVARSSGWPRRRASTRSRRRRMQEDHVSMGWAPPASCAASVDALTRVLAIEMLTRGPRARAARAARARARPPAAVVAALREHGRRARARPLPVARDRGRASRAGRARRVVLAAAERRSRTRSQ